jgi:hypothetical protein
MAKLLNAIWVHQFDKLVEKSLEEIESRWAGQLYVKALDGIYLMGEMGEDHGDQSPLSVRGYNGGGSGDSAWTWKNSAVTDIAQKPWIPWVNPRGLDLQREPWAASLLTSDSIILDLEPYAGFWQGSDKDLQTWVWGLAGRPFDVCVDYRRLYSFPPPWLMNEAGRVLAECYWTEFQQPWETVLTEAARILEPYAAPELVLPGNARGCDLDDALHWAYDRGFRCSIWVWQQLGADGWRVADNARDVTFTAKGE